MPGGRAGTQDWFPAAPRNGRRRPRDRHRDTGPGKDGRHRTRIPAAVHSGTGRAASGNNGLRSGRGVPAPRQSKIFQPTVSNAHPRRSRRPSTGAGSPEWLPKCRGTADTVRPSYLAYLYLAYRPPPGSVLKVRFAGIHRSIRITPAVWARVSWRARWLRKHVAMGTRLSTLAPPRCFAILPSRARTAVCAFWLVRLSRIDVLVIDDWAWLPSPNPSAGTSGRSVRIAIRCAQTILTSQLPVSRWIGDPTLADSILDRLVHNAHRMDMRGDSMRKNRGKSA